MLDLIQNIANAFGNVADILAFYLSLFILYGVAGGVVVAVIAYFTLTLSDMRKAARWRDRMKAIERARKVRDMQWDAPKRSVIHFIPTMSESDLQRSKSRAIRPMIGD